MGKKGRRPPSDSEDEELYGEDADMEELDALEDAAGAESDEDEDAAGLQAPGQKQRRKGSVRPDRDPIYDTEAMHEKIEDFGWSDVVPWEETLALTGDDPTQVENVDDDLARELAFYNQALAAAQTAISKFDAAGTPWLRPPDYYAEMVKSDEHMAKVKEQLMFEQRAIEQAEERRKAREAKQYAKQVQAEKQKERNAAKKKQIDDVSKLRKQREKSGFAGELDYDAEMQAMEKSGRKQPGFRDRNAAAGGRGGMNKKRAQRDAKFGFGGKKKLRKQNDATSAADMDGFRPPRRELGGGGRGGGRGGGSGGRGGGGGGRGGGRPGGAGAGAGGRGPGGPKGKPMKRPGKSARQNMRGKGKR